MLVTVNHAFTHTSGMSTAYWQDNNGRRQKPVSVVDQE